MIHFLDRTDSRQNSVPLCPLMDCPLPHLLEVMRCAPNLAYLLAEKLVISSSSKKELGSVVSNASVNLL